LQLHVSITHPFYNQLQYEKRTTENERSFGGVSRHYAHNGKKDVRKVDCCGGSHAVPPRPSGKGKAATEITTKESEVKVTG
jgi:hypothetical protein